MTHPSVWADQAGSNVNHAPTAMTYAFEIRLDLPLFVCPAAACQVLARWQDHMAEGGRVGGLPAVHGSCRQRG